MTVNRRKARIAALRQLMKDARVPALLVTRREDVRYLTGFTGSSGVVLIGSGRPCLVTDFRYDLQAHDETTGVTVVIQKKDWISAVVETSKRRGVPRLCFEPSTVTVDVHNKLMKAGLRLSACGSDLVGELRQQKDQTELRSIRRAVLRAEEAFRRIRRSITAGVRERDIALRLDFLMRELGSRKPAFDTIVASGTNGAMPHASVTDRTIRSGDLVTIDFGAEADGYFCDITRTVCAGRPTARQREVHDLVLRAQECAIAFVRPGAGCKDIDAAARNVITKADHDRHFGHSTGHGVGLMVHEGPAISPLSRGTVREGMIFTVEPGVYIPGWGGVRIEDMVRVTAGGAAVLTTLPREL
jgi:Xaa-Pro aminopeptidase